MLEEQVTSKSIARVIFGYKFILLALVLLFIGILLLVVSAYEPERESNILIILLRDIGIALIPASTIILANEVYTRLQFEQMIKDKMHDVIEESHSLAQRFGNIEENLNQSVESIQENLNESFESIENQNAEILSAIPFAIQLRALGVSELRRSRPDTTRLVEILRAADSGSDIYMLGIALTILEDGRIQREVTKKLEQGCKIKLLWLDPNSPHVRQRASEEFRPYGELKEDIATHDKLHVNFITQRLSNYGDNIKYGRYNSLPSYFIFMTNITMIVGFYLPGARGIFFPHIELARREGGIYDAFREQFNSLWSVTHNDKMDAADAEPV